MIELMRYRTGKNTITLNSQMKKRAGSGIIGDCLFYGPRIQKLAQDLKRAVTRVMLKTTKTSGIQREECNLSSLYESLNACGDIWMVEEDF